MTQKSKGIAWLLLFSAIFVLLCLFAVRVPSFCVENFKDTFSENTGYIGDTIGGTVTPYLTIITALLAFIALGFQFISMRQQNLDLKIERMDNRFYNMLDVYQTNTTRLMAGNKKGKDAAEELAGELMCIYTILYSLYETEYKQLITSSTLDPILLGKINLFLQSLNQDVTKKKEFITNVAYGLFYYGWNYTYPYSTSTDEIFRFTEILKERLKQVEYIEDKNQAFSTWLKKEEPVCELEHYSSPYPICNGHNDELGCYYRQMYQIVKLVVNADKSIYDEKSKSDHMRILRSQMSDCEQMLLLYNTVSDFGKRWNNRKNTINSPEDMGYIARFRMIKNIPANVYWRGVFPIDLYAQENQYWRTKNIDMFECSQMLQVDEN